MFTLVLGLIILTAILLVLVILAQNSKGGGLTSQFGGSGASNMIGVKKTGDLLEKLTWGMITTIFVLAIASNFLVEENTGVRDEFIDRAQEQQVAPSLDLGDVENAEEGSVEGLEAIPEEHTEDDGDNE